MGRKIVLAILVLVIFSMVYFAYANPEDPKMWIFQKTVIIKPASVSANIDVNGNYEVNQTQQIKITLWDNKNETITCVVSLYIYQNGTKVFYKGLGLIDITPDQKTLMMNWTPKQTGDTTIKLVIQKHS